MCNSKIDFKTDFLVIFLKFVYILKLCCKSPATPLNPNTEWLKAWDGNMDLQICLDFFAIITYITGTRIMAGTWLGEIPFRFCLPAWPWLGRETSSTSYHSLYRLLHKVRNRNDVKNDGGCQGM